MRRLTEYMLEVGRRNANAALFNGKTRAVESAVGLSNITRTIIVFRTPPDQIAFATRPDSVRHPTRFRTPPDQIPYAARPGSGRNTPLKRLL
ncbi:hypothetical protein [Leyella stercorea]|uniref:hypothetical protein n=1 Tax=Leyella stercorea TaxID=363265 RepID=UPI00241E19DE|nr:hypothetical protein [Leyella stercorea]